jgi:hypothetical protein
VRALLTLQDLLLEVMFFILVFHVSDKGSTIVFVFVTWVNPSYMSCAGFVSENDNAAFNMSDLDDMTRDDTDPQDIIGSSQLAGAPGPDTQERPSSLPLKATTCPARRADRPDQFTYPPTKSMCRRELDEANVGSRISSYEMYRTVYLVFGHGIYSERNC